MKYLVILVVVVVAYVLWRNARLSERARRDAAAAPARAAAPQAIVSCAVCGLHLPQSDAVAGTGGLMYCSQEHRLLSGS